MEVESLSSPISEDSSRTESEINDRLVQYESSAHCSQILAEFLSEFVLVTCKEAVNELAVNYIQARPRPADSNPIVNVMTALSMEVIDDIVVLVVRECVRERVDEHMQQRHIRMCFDVVVTELLEEVVTSLCDDTLWQLNTEAASRYILTALVRDELAPEVATETLRTERETLDEWERAVDRAAISKALHATVAPRLLLMHLLMSMTNRFDAVMVRHFVKGIARRLVAHRILRLMDGLESRVSTVTQNGEMEALLFETMALPALQDELVAELLTSALHQQEEDVDFIEKQFRLFTGSLDDAR